MSKKLSKDEISEKIGNGYIRVRAVVEMLGAPKDYIVKTLKMYIEKLNREKEIIVLKEKYAPAKKQDKLFSTFADVEMLVKNASELAFFCFDYMPSSIEIMEPNVFTYKSADFAAFFNDMQVRLHRLDMVMKNLTAKTQVLERNATLLLRNNILILLKEEDKDLMKLSKGSGIPAQQLVPFLEKLVKEGWLKEKKGMYSRAKK